MTDEDFMSIRSSDTGNSNIRDMTQRNSHTDSSRRSRSSIKDDEEANSNSSISNQNGAATEPLSIPSQIASPPRKLQQSDIGCTGRNTVGAIMCAVFAIAWIFFLFWKDGGSNLLTKPKSSGTGWNPPTTELCSSISNGVDIIGDSHLQERLQVKLELQLQSAPDDMNATALESDWKDKLQENVMPILAGCEDAMRRFLLASTKEGQTLRQRQRARSLNQLPDYVVSNALVVNTTLSWLEIVSQEEQESSLLEQSVYTYPLLVDIDLWLKEEVNNDLLVSRVSKVFNDFLEDTPLVTDLQLADSELVNVQQPPSTTTDNPTISDGFATSPSTTPEIPDSVTNAPVEMPTSRPISFQTLTPSDSPSMSVNSREPTGLPITESPTISPGNQSLTENPTNNSTMVPSADAGNIMEPTGSPSTESPTLSPSNQTTTFSPTANMTT